MLAGDMEEFFMPFQLCKSAQGWADTLATNQTDPEEEAGDAEALACGSMVYVSPEYLKPESLINLWYKEGESYEYDHHRTSSGVSSGKSTFPFLLSIFEFPNIPDSFNNFSLFVCWKRNSYVSSGKVKSHFPVANFCTANIGLSPNSEEHAQFVVLLFRN